MDRSATPRGPRAGDDHVECVRRHNSSKDGVATEGHPYNHAAFALLSFKCTVARAAALNTRRAGKCCSTEISNSPARWANSNNSSALKLLSIDSAPSCRIKRFFKTNLPSVV